MAIRDDNDDMFEDTECVSLQTQQISKKSQQ